MREILFRGKRKDNGEWIEGCYVYDEYQSWIIEYGENISYEIVPETVGQWTEKYDKYNAKIWEGNRVRETTTSLSGEVSVEIKEVKFNPNYGWGIIKSELCCEVIGNVHEEEE